MLVSELITRFHEYVARDVSVEGVLLVGADARLVADADKPTEACVLLPHPQVAERLMQVVPVWGGGAHIYMEDATVVGTLADDPLRFTAVRSLTVRRDDELYEFADLS